MSNVSHYFVALEEAPNPQPIDALLWTAVINGFIDPPLLLLIMLIANNRKIMGARVNGWRLNLLGFATTLA